MIYRGISLNVEILQHARTYQKRHLSPVFVQKIITGQVFCRKGTRSVRWDERVVFDQKETRQLVRIFEESQE